MCEKSGFKVLPNPTTAVIMDKGKPRSREFHIVIKQDGPKSGFVLEVLETPTSWRAKSTIALMYTISEMKTADTLQLIAADQEIELRFGNVQDALAYHTFIISASEIHAENTAISQLDDEMRRIWPFPGGSYF